MCKNTHFNLILKQLKGTSVCKWLIILFHLSETKVLGKVCGFCQRKSHSFRHHRVHQNVLNI